MMSALYFLVAMKSVLFLHKRCIYIMRWTNINIKFIIRLASSRFFFLSEELLSIVFCLGFFLNYHAGT